MDGPLEALLAAGGGLVTRTAALQVVPRWTLRRACQVGHLVRVLPEVFADARLIGTPTTGPPAARLRQEHRRRATVLYADGRGALSGPTALAVWGVREQPPDEHVHLDVPAPCGMRSRDFLTVHHRADRRPGSVVRAGLPVTGLEHALVDSWPLLAPAERAAPVILAVNRRLSLPGRIHDALAEAPRLRHRAALRTLLHRLAAGCRSPLEIWGHDRVFVGPSMPAFQRQKAVRVGGRVHYLDMYAERERVDVELDGAATHGAPEQRKIDLRRDALLATAGILVLRFSHRRLVHEPDAVRREVAAVLATRLSMRVRVDADHLPLTVFPSNR